VSLPVAILCGGLGTRLYPLTQQTPKALIEILDEPFLAHQLRLLKSSGIEKVVLLVGRFGESLRDYAGDGARFGLKVEYSFDGPVLLGTGGAVRQALPLLGDEFFVLYGDSYLPCDYRAVVSSFHAAGKQALMTVFRNEGKWDTSNVEISADGQSIRAYDKKNQTPRMHYIDYGLGAFRASAFDRVPPATFFDLAELYQQVLAEGQLSAHVIEERFYEVGSFKGIEELGTFLAGKRER
jgi:NDP-sugar pyrophosphorylase family protein